VIKNSLIIFMCIFNLIVPSTAFAGDVVPKGTVLSQESYVFTIDEATKLLKRIEELEAKEVELNKYKQLEELRVKQIDLYKLNLDYSQAQVDRYAGLLDTNSELIQRYQKRSEIQYWENFGYLALGITLTVGAFLAADAITDHMESTR
tara:strand:+ start:4440 stop:4883 length:444 start_codon:yes stop_codon:yes gene_type:complete